MSNSTTSSSSFQHHQPPTSSTTSSLSSSSSSGNNVIKETQETLEIAYEINNILNAGLDRESLSIIMNLCEMGINPEALAACVKEIKTEANKLKQL
ncbi:hypothetical protein FDP41_011520 [Naegleria fowleri]|uniref:Mitotic-spindle organizing protein 1 n=1 Tax=Naegleria fowleri TaxID=5763 RepID=A0A6A5CA71_NAEFO|nr:uncharacterized protein FDP41_011520 [Naegleria fowleri]KAF0982590.1 hypothetical protein FDP41_011520 [Naegleria fowleri]CAG4714203.1 unnamed protein product [Naegleria fowleri]